MKVIAFSLMMVGMACLISGPVFATDFDNDGNEEITIFRPGSGLWSIRGVTRFYFGAEDDLPFLCDFDGDGIIEIAINRDDTGLWAIRGMTRIYYGQAGDVPVIGGGRIVGRFRPGTMIIGYTPGGGTVLNSWTKVAEFALGQSGDIRVAFSLKSSGWGDLVYGRIYRNGSPVGEERSTSSGEPVPFIEDINSWNPGDNCQLWMKSPSEIYGEYLDYKIMVGPGPFCTYISPAGCR